MYDFPKKTDRERQLNHESFTDQIPRIYGRDAFIPTEENIKKYGEGVKSLTRTVTFQVTDACNLACRYCYQINKGTRRMSFEVAKKFIDLLLSGDKGFDEYLQIDAVPAIIIEFIGGEPFLEIELIDKITNYFFNEMIRLNHKWVDKWMISICSNGVLYRDPRVQRYLNHWRDNLSFSVTIDGNKELHDSGRVFPDGSPSYDIAWDAASDWMSKGHKLGSKITIAPCNSQYLYDAISHFVEQGYDEINANCVFEEGWTNELATYFYHELVRVADYFIENEYVDKVYLALFIENYFKPKSIEDNDNWCGGTGAMLSCDPDGNLYPCIRYMESSVGNDQVPFRIGDVENGIGKSCEHCSRIDCIHKITRRSESTDKCFYCPIAEGCAWCSAYNYQVNGTPDSRATYICCTHIARALANAYYWCKWYEKKGVIKSYELWVPEEWALNIITKEEWDRLVSMPNLIVKTVHDDAYQKRLNLDDTNGFDYTKYLK